MKTRVKDFLDTSAEPWTPVYSFQFAQTKRPLAGDWRYPAASKGQLAYWRTKGDRDRARACFTSRRSVEAASADLKRLKLLPRVAKERRAA